MYECETIIYVKSRIKCKIVIICTEKDLILSGRDQHQ